MTTDRRTFLTASLKTVGLTLSAPAIATILASCERTETSPTSSGGIFTIDIKAYPELNEIGSITSVAITGLNGDRLIFISRVALETFAVFSTVCTHQGCTVELPEYAGSNCICPCHFAEYSPIDGSIIRQPNIGSATNLPTFASSFDTTTNILTIMS